MNNSSLLESYYEFFWSYERIAPEAIMEFEYKFLTKNNFTIITFKGRMSKEAKESLLQCQQELLALDSKVVIFLFKDVPTVDQVVNRELAILQQEVRKSKQLFLVGINKNLKLLLLEKGILRQNEIRESLEDTLKSLEK